MERKKVAIRFNTDIRNRTINGTLEDGVAKALSVIDVFMQKNGITDYEPVINRNDSETVFVDILHKDTGYLNRMFATITYWW